MQVGTGTTPNLAQHDPGGANAPSGDLASSINQSFESFDKFKEQFSAASKGVFLARDGAELCVGSDKKLFITSTPNQDNPLMSNIAKATGTPNTGTGCVGACLLFALPE